MSPLSVSGGIGSSQKGSLRARIRTDYYLTNPHKVADRRKPAPMEPLIAHKRPALPE
jgi:hypothetical protein